ncbi:hypothetical protein BASA83_003598 [Batrachochytrium salamandrivorans]|nr:hypothetical protein BASA83_003598 [Batrachochytrium salamandrivorans]
MPLEYALQYRGQNPDPGPWKLPRSVSVRPSETLGISELPVQRVRRSKRPIYVQSDGCGLSEGRGQKNLSATKTVSVNPTTYELTEEGVTLMLTVIDTPGFGDQLNREQSGVKSEKSAIRQNILTLESMPFCFSSPNWRLRDLDLEFLQRLSAKVNIIPVIGKADSLAPEEATAYKQAILRDFGTYDIRIYPNHHAEDRDFVPNIERFIPFTVIGSDTFVNVGGKDVRGRTYRWGTVEVENPAHCDFVHLRELLIRTNMQDLIDTTHSVHYSQYRGFKIRGKHRPESFLACDDYYETRIDTAKRSLAEDMQRKEDDMRQRFVAKVREKELNLREREDALNNTRQKMMEELETLRRNVENEESSVNELAVS